MYNGKLLRKFCGPNGPFRDLKTSGHGSKAFVLGESWIKAVSMQTGKNTGSVEVGSTEGFCLIVDGSRVGINKSHHSGWDFGGPEVSDFKEFTDRPRLDLINSCPGHQINPFLVSIPRWIEDTTTKRLVFRLPERYIVSES